MTIWEKVYSCLVLAFTLCLGALLSFLAFARLVAKSSITESQALNFIVIGFLVLVLGISWLTSLLPWRLAIVPTVVQIVFLGMTMVGIPVAILGIFLLWRRFGRSPILVNQDATIVSPSETPKTSFSVTTRIYVALAIVTSIFMMYSCTIIVFMMRNKTLSSSIPFIVTFAIGLVLCLISIVQLRQAVLSKKLLISQVVFLAISGFGIPLAIWGLFLLRKLQAGTMTRPVLGSSDAPES